MTYMTVSKTKWLLLFFLLSLGASVLGQAGDTRKPWTYWWWMGSAANRADITWQMERFAAKGLGGVHIIPIYGAKGFESKFVPFLSRDWVDLLQFTIGEGRRLGLGVDMTTGTGWPFGGPDVTPGMAAMKWEIENGEVVTGMTKQMVKRAAPGGEGLVLDPFGSGNMEKYLQKFDRAFNGLEELPRSLYNDSYEVYGANWTPGFAGEFTKRRGYPFAEAVGMLSGKGSDEEKELVRIDYRQTLAELLREHYTVPWVEWSRQRGMKTRLQAHGSPANILDIYAEADIPETESFGTSQFPIPGLRVDPDFEEERFGKPNPLAMKMASSPAHLAGKPLVSSETTTWLANHFKVSLSQVKPQVDELFVSGINHIFYHGTTYTPRDEPFPGWLFYASTNYGPHSHFDKHFHLLNAYATRIQTYLQQSVPKNDILLYFPIHDLWAEAGEEPVSIRMLDVHHTEKWLARLPFGIIAKDLWEEGYTFDYISDNQLKAVKSMADGRLDTGGGIYKALLIPACANLPESTLDELKRLSEKGVSIIFEGPLPNRATGWAGNAARSMKLREDLALLAKKKNVFTSGNWRSELEAAGAVPEMIAGKGLQFIRKEYGNRAFYFIANLSNRFNAGWIKLNNIAGAATASEPLTGLKYKLPVRETGGVREFFIRLLPGESVMILDEEQAAGPEPRYPAGHSFSLAGSWKLTFTEGQPRLPGPVVMQDLKSWTALPDSGAYFSGTAVYRLQFDLPDGIPLQREIVLDLGDVREVAEVRLNGKDAGTAWSIPFQLRLPAGALKRKQNVLEVAVTNLSANYMRLLDEKSPGWKKFYDINIVDITYHPFKAALWEPMPSGLLTGVKLLY